MGKIWIAVNLCALSSAYLLHSVFDTPYDWIFLGIAVLALSYFMDDSKLEALLKMWKWVNRGGK